MFSGMADGSLVLQLDVIFASLTCLTLLHAITKRGLFQGIAVVAYLFLHTAAFEHMSLFLGGTHCHASSPTLPMITPCSSINSVLFYVPWTYTSVGAARRMDLRPTAFPFAVGLLQFGFGAVYEMQGPWHRLFNWPDATGAIAESPALEAWEGYPPLAFLADAKEQNEVATITSGVFRVAHHANGALDERVYMFPLLAPYFHFAFGFGWAAGLALTGSVRTMPSLKRLVTAGLLSVALFLPPIWVTRGVSEAVGLPLALGVPISLALSFVMVLLIGRKQRAAGLAEEASDPLLFVISLAMHAFFVSFAWRATKDTPPGLFALVASTAAMHLVAQYKCCFATGEVSKKKKM